MASAGASVKETGEHPQGIPLLEAGDHLSRAEFERRYEAMPHLKKAELIDGEVYMPSPVRWNQHAGPHADLIGWLSFYRAYTPGVRVGDNGSLRLDMDNEPQADTAMIVEPAFGDQVRLENDYVSGGPEWVGEIAASSASIDLHRKFRVYRRNGVREYVVWPVALHPTGVYQSHMFPGLWLDPAAMAQGDAAKVLQVLQQGLASPEHATFAARLQAQHKPD